MAGDAPRTVAVVAGGDAVDPSLATRLPTIDYVIAADSGLHAARQLGLDVDLLVGDLDSVDTELLDDPAFTIERHPRAKDRTDLVLALDRARDLGASRVIVISGGGGRLDHTLATLLVLAADDYAHIDVEAHVGPAHVAVVRRHLPLSGAAGAIISLFAVGGPAQGVTTKGLRYPLRDEVLDDRSSRGVSNEFEGGTASITVTDGTLLVICAGQEG